MRKAVTAAVSLILLTGCWSMNYNEPGRVENYDRYPTEITINRSFADSWDSVKQVMAKFPILEAKVDLKSDRAYLISDWIPGKSDILYSGYLDEVRIPYVIRYKLYVYVVGDNAGRKTRISIKNVEEYLTDVITGELDINRSIYQWVRTPSSTLKEHKILTEIKKTLKIVDKRG